MEKKRRAVGHQHLMKILVTGACGFLGSALCKELVKQNYQVVGISRRKNVKLLKEVIDKNNFQFFEVDISKKEKVFELPNDVKIIFHTAAQLPGQKNEEFDNYLKNNVKGTYNLLEYAVKSEVNLFVHSSTGSVYGLIDNKITDKSQENPLDYYGLTKLFSEQIVKMFAIKHKLKSIIFRYSIIYGEEDRRSMINKYINLARNNQKIIINKKYGRKYRNLVHVKDVVAFHVKALSLLKKMPIYSMFLVGCEKSEKIWDIARKIVKENKSQSKVILDERNESVVTSNVVSYDISKTKEVFGFHPLSIKEGIEEISRTRG